MKNTIKKVKAFSLVETLITLAIFGILMAMLTQVLLINITVSRKAFARSLIREELSEIISLIQRDIRNSKAISNCGIFTDGASPEAKCQIAHVDEFIWTDNCSDYSGDDIPRICKLTVVDTSDPDAEPEVLFMSSDLLSIDQLGFEISVQQGADGTKSTILVTILASSANPNLEVNNQVRQVAVSTRNYTLGDFYIEDPTPTPKVALFSSY